MKKNTTHDTAHSNIIEIINRNYPDHEPVVRYAIPDEDGVPKQEPILRSIHDSIPQGANWASGIYLITERQRNLLDENSDEPYGNLAPDNVGKTIQDECENAGRVLYSVHAESDAHEDDDDDDSAIVLLPTMVEWLREFVQTVIDIDPDDCSFYYSGNRSIHVHCPLFVTGENLQWLKEQTKQFCDRTGYELDASVYKRKQQFRLPGAVHQDNGGAFQKVKIGTGWERPQIISAATNEVPQPETYADVLETIFTLDEPTELSELLIASSATDTKSQSQTSSLLSTWPSRYHRPSIDKKRAYDAKEFYPYPTGGDSDGRSVASIRVADDEFQRKERGKNRTFIPCFFYGAHSCSGRDFTKDQEYSPLQLSKKDAKKWDYEEGDNIVFIGGGNYESITYKVGETTAKEVGDLLDPDDGNREVAMKYLETQGYDVGSSGRSQEPSISTDQQSQEEDHADSSEPETRAGKLQQRAEQEGIELSLGHQNRRDVANRLLTIGGWDEAWQWFSEQYGGDFDPKRTWDAFKSVIDTHSEDFIHIEVPPQP